MRRKLSPLATAVLLALSGCAPAMLQTPPEPVQVMLRNAQGVHVGNATLTEQAGGVRLILLVRGLPAGPHAVHVHEAGRCEPPAFTSAGGHFNPAGRGHGFENPQGPHAGDLPNMTVDAQGEGRLEATARFLTLGEADLGSGEARRYSLRHPAGTALVVHAVADDNRSDPAGNAGARVACGVITAP